MPDTPSPGDDQGQSTTPTDPQPNDTPATTPTAPAQGQTPPATGGEKKKSEPDWSTLGDFEEVQEALRNARKWEKRAKENHEKAQRLDQLEAESKTELQKATERAEQLQQQYQAAINAAVRAEIKAAATGWADPDDAPRYIDDPTAYVKDDGSIDAKAIKKDVDAALKAKPHLAARAPDSGGQQMFSDPAQGAAGGMTLPEQIQQAESKGDVKTAIALKSAALLQSQQQQRRG